MRETRIKALEAVGWRVGTAEQFLKLSEDEAAFVEMKLALAGGVRELRLSASLTQSEVAKVIGSSQSRVAKMEAADSSVSLDLLVRTLLRLGASAETVAILMTNPRRQKAAV